MLYGLTVYVKCFLSAFQYFVCFLLHDFVFFTSIFCALVSLSLYFNLLRLEFDIVMI